jgi:hypothetical protein
LVGEYYRLTNAGVSSSNAIEKSRAKLVAQGHQISWSDESAFHKIRRKVLAIYKGLRTTGKNSA